MKKTGFALIELAIVVAIIGIVTVVGVNAYKAYKDPNVSFGVTGMTEQRCIGGFKYVVGHRGVPAQVINERGGGVACGSLDKP